MNAVCTLHVPRIIFNLEKYTGDHKTGNRLTAIFAKSHPAIGNGVEVFLHSNQKSSSVDLWRNNGGHFTLASKNSGRFYRCF